MNFNHLTRPTKIRIALAFVVLGGLAWAVWPGEEQGVVSITFAGVSTTNSPLPLFTITNGSKKSLTYLMGFERQTNGVWPERYASWPFMNGTITNQSARTLICPMDKTNRWRLGMTYWDASASPFASETRMKLAVGALSHGWIRLSKWVEPMPKLKIVYGPVMLGNQPAPPAKK